MQVFVNIIELKLKASIILPLMHHLVTKIQRGSLVLLKRTVEASIATPSVFFKDIENGFMLLEDFGDQTYFNKLNSLKEKNNFGEINTLYESAIDTLVDIQAKVDGTSLKFYESKLLFEEMELFTNWFCDLFLELEVDERARKLISKTFTFLTEASVSQKQVPVHRDYHSRNLMVLEESNYHPTSKTWSN